MSDKSNIPEITDSDCLAAMDHLYAYLNGELKDKEKHALVEHHLGHCKSCFSRAEMERQINSRLKASGVKEMPETLQKRLRGILDKF